MAGSLHWVMLFDWNCQSKLGIWRACAQRSASRMPHQACGNEPLRGWQWLRQDPIAGPGVLRSWSLTTATMDCLPLMARAALAPADRHRRSALDLRAELGTRAGRACVQTGLGGTMRSTPAARPFRKQTTRLARTPTPPPSAATSQPCRFTAWLRPPAPSRRHPPAPGSAMRPGFLPAARPGWRRGSPWTHAGCAGTRRSQAAPATAPARPPQR